MSTFIDGACRKLNGMTAVTVLFDVHMSVPKFAPLTSLEDCTCNRNAHSLPEGILLPRALPDGCRMGIVARNMEDSALQVIKTLYFADKVNPKDALKYCAGTPCGLISRPGPRVLKKALVSLLGRLPGFQQYN